VFAGAAVIVACGALVAAGVVVVVRWGAGASAPRESARPVRYVAGMLATGVAAGVLAAGAGGRLVMRLLAVTSPDSQGMVTEGNAIVGEISVGGTVAFIAFAGVAAGALSALLYALAGSLLPRGRAGGVALGLLLLVLAGARLDPLRGDNFDFNLVGPDWLSLLSFTVLAVFQGMLTWALAGRLGLRPLPLPLGRALTAGRVAAGVLVLVALPGFVGSVAEILG
jgi:hypothetical protein